MYDDRPIFLFYAVAIAAVPGARAHARHGQADRPAAPPLATAYRRAWSWPASFFVLVLLNFAWFWPIWTDGLLTHAEWLDRIWFSRWI